MIVLEDLRCLGERNFVILFVLASFLWIPFEDEHGSFLGKLTSLYKNPIHAAMLPPPIPNGEWFEDGEARLRY